MDMKSLKGIIIILITVLSGTSFALACAVHSPDFYEEPPAEPGIEDAFIKIHSGEVWHLDVGSSHPGAGAGPKGLAVRQLKRYASWV